MPVRSPVTFAANGGYFVSGGTKGVQVWRAEDSHLVATIEAEHVQCVAFSKDGKWIAAGTYFGDVMVWDAKVFKQLYTTWRTEGVIRGVDFSPDSARLLVLGDHTATVWDIDTRQRVVGPLHHNDRVWAAKYSPRGDRILTATQRSVRVYPSSTECRSPVDVPVQITTNHYNAGFLWSREHLFVITDSCIREIDASTGSGVSEWSVPDTNDSSCITVPKHGKFIACSANHTVTFWDTATHTQLGVLHHTQDIHSIALSPDGRFLAIGGEDEKIIIKRLSRITEPDVQIDGAAIHLWKLDELVNGAFLVAPISLSLNPDHHYALARQALARARLGQWDEAIADAEESIATHPSAIGYIAKSVSLVGKGAKHEAYRACDIAFEHLHSTNISFLLLIKAVIVCMIGEHDDAISRTDDLITTLHLNSICYVVQAYMYLCSGNSHMERGDYRGAIRSFKRAQARLRPDTSQALSVISLISGWNFDDLEITIRQRLCESLHAAGRTIEAGESLLDIVTEFTQEVYMGGAITDWVGDFLDQCLSVHASRRDEPAPNDLHLQAFAPLLTEWSKLILTRRPWQGAVDAAVGFMFPKFTIYRAICERLDTLEKVMDATECFRQMMSELGELNLHAEQASFLSDFKQHLSEKLVLLGDAAMNAQRHDAAIFEYSAALSLDPPSLPSLLIKRSKAYVAKGSWESALRDANKVIALDPSSPWGYERKHAALHKAGRFDDAIGMFEMMLAKISQSPDPEIRKRREEYVLPAQTNAVIRKTVQNVVRALPRVLVNTHSGRLLDKTKQSSLFETLPVFKELISSMATHIDQAHIQREVEQYYHYATFSHTWEDNEPRFEDVKDIAVYDLDQSFTHDKLQMFCKFARDAGLHWAWSDTCCIDKSDHFVLQEALVAMFKWYEGSAVTIVFLRGVRSPSRRGDLANSHWNTRAWPFQEYHASKVVRFYTEDWTPYLNLDIPNHKESPEIIAEMEEATGISASALMALRPGPNDIREKLSLASGRETTYAEDAAYSLLGIFSVTLPIVYGEGDHALGRLLAQLLTGSGDTSILAWTGESGSFNSCLPANITVFKELSTSHISPTLVGPDMPTAPRMRATSPNFYLAMKLYDQLHGLPLPSFAGPRMRLPCLTFQLGPVEKTPGERYVFKARAGTLGIVEIKTTENLSRLGSLTLVHPWIDFLLDRHPFENNTDATAESTMVSADNSPSRPSTAHGVRRTRTSRIMHHLGRPFMTWAGEEDSLRSPPTVSLTDKRARALQFVDRLKQPFGALLLKLNRQNVDEYKRVASESLITVQVGELTSTVLNKMIEDARTLDVL